MSLAIAVIGVPALSAQRVVGGHLRSDSLPRVAIAVSTDFVYLGSLQYNMGDVAEATAFVFGDTLGGVLRKAFIAHFEHFVSENDRVFRYPRLAMVRLGAHEYLHQTWALQDFALFSLPAMQQFLAARHLRVDGPWLVDRYVRVVDPNRKHESILFYLESAAINDPGIYYGGIASNNDPPPVPPQAVRKTLASRAGRAFTIRDR